MTDLLNQVAPDFSLKDQEGKVHQLSDYRGTLVLLYFYPKDNTPGCTVEAQCFRDRFNDLKALNVQVLGVSIDDEASHKKFSEQEKLNFPILADADKTVVKAYGVEGLIFAKRESFLIDKAGKVLKHYKKVAPKDHAEEVIKDVTALEPSI
ncbi:MAG: peroxiredoxin [Candidatus Gracilibacteria bacterium]